MYARLARTALKVYPRLAFQVIPRLQSVDIEPTNACNLRCKMCYSRNRRTGYMQWDLFKKVVDELTLSYHGLRLGLNLGGESLLHPRFVDMLSHVCGKPAFKEVGFNTNGMLLDKDMISDLLKTSVDWIEVSLEGLGEVNDNIRLGCNYEQVKDNVLMLLQARGARVKPRITLNVTQSSQSQADIMQFIEFWTKYVDAVYVNPALDENLHVPDSFFGDFPVQTQRFCTSPFGYMGILWDGSVVVCCGDWNGVNVMGNVEHETVQQIWRGSRFKELRYAQLTHQHNGSLCQKCNWWQRNFRRDTYATNSGVLVSMYGHCKEFKRKQEAITT